MSALLCLRRVNVVALLERVLGTLVFHLVFLSHPASTDWACSSYHEQIHLVDLTKSGGAHGDVRAGRISPDDSGQCDREGSFRLKAAL